MKLKSTRAFTLPELMVVILILAILMAVAIPVYLAASNRAVARSAQNRLRDSVTAAKNLYSDVDIAYNAQTKAQLDEEAQPITFVIGGAPPTGSIQVYVTASTATTMTLQTRDANDNIWQAAIAANGAVTYSEVP